MKNNLYKAALLAALGLGSVSAVHAGTTDVLLGFNDAAGPGTAQNDDVTDLGYNAAGLVAAAIANGGTVVLSSDFNWSTFGTAFSTDASAGNDVAVGAVAGQTGANPKFLFQSAGVTPPPQPSRGQFNPAASNAQAPTIGEYASSTTGGWSYWVAQSPTVGDADPGHTGVADSTGNPLFSLYNGFAQFNLWETTASGLSGVPTTWVDLGYFDVNVDSDTVTFSVPEPATYGMVAGAGLLLLSLRRQFVRKIA